MNDVQPSTPTTIAEYLEVNAVQVAPLDGAAASELGFALELPAGWQELDPAQFPGATSVIVEPNMVENGFAPNAVLLVGRLSRAIDPNEVLELGFGDGTAMPGWVEREANRNTFAGWPSCFVRGGYAGQQLEAAVTTRYVVVGTDPCYLVQLTVTTLESQLDALAFDIAAINDGLEVAQA